MTSRRDDPRTGSAMDDLFLDHPRTAPSIPRRVILFATDLPERPKTERSRNAGS